MTPRPCSAEMEPFSAAVERGQQSECVSPTSRGAKRGAEGRTGELIDQGLDRLLNLRVPLLSTDVDVKVRVAHVAVCEGGFRVRTTAAKCDLEKRSEK